MKIEIPIEESVTANYENGLLTVTKGGVSNSKHLDHPMVKFIILKDKIVLEAEGESRRQKKILNTYRAHIKNLIKGLHEPFVYKLKICYSHFPMDVSVSGDEVLIKNFLGEKKARKAKIVAGAKVEINGDIITVTSSNKEIAGQTASNLELATRLRKRDRRRFQDGIFITLKAGKEQ